MMRVLYGVAHLHFLFYIQCLFLAAFLAALLALGVGLARGETQDATVQRYDHADKTEEIRRALESTSSAACP